MKPSRLHRAEALEDRLVLAGLLTFTDVDGDIVAVRTSRGTDASLAAAVGLAPSGVGQQLRSILLDASFAGTNLSVIVRTRAMGGDGAVNVGDLRSAAALGTVTISGDLGAVRLRDPGSHSIARLRVGSLGVQGMTTGAADNRSAVMGSIGSLEVAGDIRRASLYVGQRLEKAAVGGSIVGTNTGDGITAGGIGSISVARSVFGGPQLFSGVIMSSQEIGRVRIGGDVVGGAGDSSGKIESGATSRIADCRIAGGVFGGSGVTSGAIFAGTGGLGTIAVGSSVVGGAGDNSGMLAASGDMRSVRIGGSVTGGSGFSSGIVFTLYGIGTIRIGGDIRGGTGPSSGLVRAEGGLISKLDVRSIVTGDGVEGGSVSAAVLGQATVRGDLIGSATRNATIAAKGSAWLPGATIGSVRVLGSAFRAVVLAGYDGASPVNGSVRIGTVSIAGTLSQTTIAAGVQNVGGLIRLGTAGDTAIAGGTSRIDVVAVGGRALGNGVVGESFGIVAGSVGRVRIAGNRYSPAAGSFTYPSGDNFAIHVL